MLEPANKYLCEDVIGNLKDNQKKQKRFKRKQRTKTKQTSGK